MADFFKGIGSGFMGMLGLSAYYNPLGDASSELQQVKEKMNDLTTLRSLQFDKEVNNQIRNLLQLNNLTSNQMIEMNKQTNTFINDSLQKENLFIVFCYILLFILVFFFLIQKKCC